MSEFGYVKWFNNRVGYGFITPCDDPTKDIFVHHSGLQTSNEQFRYLVQGEYVQYNVGTTMRGDKNTITAVNVTGIKGGKLMCETRELNRTNDTKKGHRVSLSQDML